MISVKKIKKIEVVTPITIYPILDNFLKYIPDCKIEKFFTPNG